MKIVRESLDFERGQNPIKAMDLGYGGIHSHEDIQKVFPKAIEISNTSMGSSLYDLGNGLFASVQYGGDFSGGASSSMTFVPKFKPHFNIVRVFKSTDSGQEDVWVNKDIKESINFERGIDPKHAMGLGKMKKIQEWMNEIGIGVRNYKVNPDFTIFTDMDVILTERKDLFPGGIFPGYINFHTSGSFDADDCGLVSLQGCPKYVQGYFSCQQNEITSLEGFPEKIDKSCYIMSNGKDFTANEILEICEVGEQVEADDSDV